MPRLQITVDGQSWEVSPTGRVTQYNRDEVGVRFRQVGGAGEVRIARFAPLGSRHADEALQELSQADLQTLFQRSMPSWTAPETGYRA